MKLSIFLSLFFLPCSLGFLPKPFVTDLPGISKPLGFFDPLGFSCNKSPIEFKKIQEAELKHGRVAMLATLGLLFQNYFHPIIGNNLAIGKSIYHYQIAANQYPWLTPLLLSVIGFTEFQTINKGWEIIENKEQIAELKEDYIPGDLGLDPFNITKDADKFKDYRTKELNNGRLAMISVILIIFQQL
jgi:hypothetical protein